MLTRRFHLLAGLALCTLGGGLVVVACDLNPQPLPPGETPGNAEDAGAGWPSGSLGNAADAGATATPSVDAGAPGAVPGADAASADAGVEPEDASPDSEAGVATDGSAPPPDASTNEDGG